MIAATLRVGIYMDSKPQKRSEHAAHPAFTLPVPLTPLIGRARELRELRRRITRDGVRLITLVGPPGVGKTRLAIETASRLASQFENRIQLVDLVPLHDRSQMLDTISRAFGARDDGSAGIEWLKRSLQHAPHLLLLDNVEHLLPGAAPDLSELLRSCPLLTILATSRETLQIRGEHVFVVSPLALPRTESHHDVTQAKRSPAVTLFANRARETAPDFTLTASNIPAVIDICRQLDGLPLAIELAAARTTIFPPEVLRTYLGHPLELLSDGARDLPARHQTLRAAMSWSYDLLDPSEQTTLLRLSVFSGGCTLEAVTHVAVPEGSAIEALTSLVRKNLIQVDQTVDVPASGNTASHETRFTLLETIREFAVEQLIHHPDMQLEAQRQHADFYLNLAEQTAAAITDPQQQVSFDDLEREHDNLRAALRWAIADDSSAELTARLGRALSWFWYSRGYLDEGWYWLARIQQREMEVPPEMRASIRSCLTAIALRRGDFPRALADALEAVALLRPTSERANLAHILGLAGQAALGVNDLDTAEQLITDGLAIARDIANPWQISGALWELSMVALRRGDFGLATELATEALSGWSEVDDKQGTVLTMDVLSTAARGLGHLDRSRQLDEESLSMRRDLRDNPGIGVSLRGLAEVALLRNQDSRARSLYGESIEIAVDVGDLPGVAACLEGLAAIAVRRDRLERAATLLGAAEQARMQSGLTEALTTPEVADCIRVIRDNLPASVFTQAWDVGRTQPLEKTISSAKTQLDGRHESAPTHIGRNIVRLPAPLSRRERQVANLIAQGYDNAQIATELVLSKRTIETHVSNILRKLDLNSRVQIVLWATHHGLTVEGSA
jgi:predicted ATPase/DNA-binding CsgD family transcriptional regulator